MTKRSDRPQSVYSAGPAVLWLNRTSWACHTVQPIDGTVSLTCRTLAISASCRIEIFALSTISCERHRRVTARAHSSNRALQHIARVAMRCSAFLSDCGIATGNG